MAGGWSASNMRPVVVGVSDARTSADPQSVLVTYALGSCVGVAFYDASKRIAALLHVLLPCSAIDEQKARVQPYTYADTGVRAVAGDLFRRGCSAGTLSVRIAGGAMVTRFDPFGIGRQNHEAVRAAVAACGLRLSGMRVGGDVYRTVRLEPGSGRMRIQEGPRLETEIPLNGAEHAH